ncbi:MAG: putative lipoprotein YbaY [Paraglaciecola sp.]|jgi:uncharacterized lipoprotein YbaY
MSFDNVNNNLNSAIVRASRGLQGAFNNISQAAFHIAPRPAKSTGSQAPQGFSGNTTHRQGAATKHALPLPNSNLRADLVKLSVNSTPAQALANGTVDPFLNIGLKMR